MQSDALYPPFEKALSLSFPGVNSGLLLIMFACPAILLLNRHTLRDGWIVLATSVAVLGAIPLLHDVPIIGGRAHLMIWVPLLVYLVLRLRDASLPVVMRGVIGVFCVVIGAVVVSSSAELARLLATSAVAQVPAAG